MATPHDDDELTPYELVNAVPDDDDAPPPESTLKPNPARPKQPAPLKDSPQIKGQAGDLTGKSTFQPARKSQTSKAQRSSAREIDDLDDSLLDEEPPAQRPGPKARAAEDDDDKFSNAGGPTLLERLLYGRVGTKQLALFYRQFSQYLLAGMDVTQSLKGLQKHFRGRALGPVIARMIDGIKSGRSLTEVCARENKVFDRLAVNMIRAAETRGAVPEILAELAEVQDFRARTIRNVASASIYPIIVLTIATGCLLVIAMFIGPLFNSILIDMIPPEKRGDLFLPTRILFGFNQAMMVLGPLTPIFALMGLIAGVWLAYKTEAGQRILDELYWYVPVFGKIQRYIDISRMGRMLGALLEAGVATPDALALTAGVVKLMPFQRDLNKAAEATREGDEIAPVLASSGRFPYEVIGLMETGETTGKLPQTLARIANDYEERATVMVRNLSTLLQPLITITLGLIVAFIAIAFVGLIVSLITSLTSGF